MGQASSLSCSKALLKLIYSVLPPFLGACFGVPGLLLAVMSVSSVQDPDMELVGSH